MTCALKLILLGVALLLGSRVSAAQSEKLTLEQTAGRGEAADFRGKLPRVRWAEDGVQLRIQRDGKWFRHDPRSGEEQAEGEESDSKEKADDSNAVMKQAIAALSGFDALSADRLVDRGRVRRSSDSTRVLLAAEGDLFFYDSKAQGALRLTYSSEEEQNSQIAPNGDFVSFVRDHNLFLVETSSGRERALSSDGGEHLFYGRLDWVYQEEIYGRGNFQAAWWSPSSSHLAYLRLEESAVHPFVVVDHLPFRLDVERTAYPKAGDPNPTVALGVARVRDGQNVWVDLSDYATQEFLVVQVGWNREGTRLIYQVQDREQTWLDLCSADPETGESKRLLRETSGSWVNVLGSPRWLADGSFVWLSERTGNKHVYHYAADGTLKRAITKGPFDVRSLLRIDEKAQQVLYLGTRDGALQRQVYQVALDGTQERRLTQDAGTHSVEFNEAGDWFLDRYNALDRPAEVRLCQRDGALVRTLAKAESSDWEKYGYRPAELLQIEARDGFLMDATLLRPPDFRPDQSYPVWLATYSGPNAPSVHHRWNSSSWHQFLAQQGVLVLQVNNRTSSGKGMVTTSQCYQRFGVRELEDLEDAVRWLTQHPWADARRVGISGWSYGGFMAAYALTHSDLFALGIAGAGVYDWRCYDTIYTERYMRMPQNNPEGYAASSCLDAAANLKGHLVLVHGTMDDNVHLQNTIQFIHALQKADKRFDLMLYPKSRHGVRDPDLRWHFRQLVWNAVQEHLGGPAGEPRTSAR
jgi:dipeptidyl-peptidase-4